MVLNMMTDDIVAHLQSMANADIAEHSQRFFKTGPGEYGAGDKFLGIRVPVLRNLVKQYKNAELADAIKLLHNEYHEIRLFALLLMVALYQSSKQIEQQKAIFDSYLANTKWINNWDLVDCSAHKILGHYLLDKNREVLFQLAVSNSLWERRIAMMATYTLIKHQQFEQTFALAELLLDDNEDLIHKVAGWMLREVGKIDLAAELRFLDLHYQCMPKTMLRYAIEKLPQSQRKHYLKVSTA